MPNPTHSNTDKGELEKQIETITQTMFVTLSEWQAGVSIDWHSAKIKGRAELLALIEQQCNQARMDERTQACYVARDILADKKIPRHASLKYFEDRIENE